MKNMFKIFGALLLLVMISVTALADSTVDYFDHGVFEFKPGSEYQATDLFENFKGVLPGDVLTQKVVITNESNVDIRIWMQQTPETWVESSMPDFLSQLRLTVKQGGKVLFDAPASESAQLTERTLLGFFPEHPKGSTELDVTLYVPADMGNEYMNQLGVVPWTFYVEEVPNDNTPHTGDWFVTGAWIAAAGALVLAIAVVLVLLMKKRRAAN